MKIVNFFFVVFCITTSLFVNAQDTITIKKDVLNDTVEIEKKEKFKFLKGYNFAISGFADFQKFKENYDLLYRLEVKISYKKFSAGYFYYFNPNTFKERLIFPNEFEFHYYYHGLFVGYEFFKYKFLTLESKVNLGRGAFKWTYEKYYFDEVFISNNYVVQPELEIGLLPFDFIKTSFIIGYRYFGTINLPNIENNDLNAFYFATGLQIILSKK